MSWCHFILSNAQFVLKLSLFRSAWATLALVRRLRPRIGTLFIEPQVSMIVRGLVRYSAVCLVESGILWKRSSCKRHIAVDLIFVSFQNRVEYACSIELWIRPNPFAWDLDTPICTLLLLKNLWQAAELLFWAHKVVYLLWLLAFNTRALHFFHFLVLRWKVRALEWHIVWNECKQSVVIKLECVTYLTVLCPDLLRLIPHLLLFLDHLEKRWKALRFLNQLVIKIFGLFLSEVDVKLFFFLLCLELKPTLFFEFTHEFHPGKTPNNKFVCHT